MITSETANNAIVIEFLLLSCSPTANTTPYMLEAKIFPINLEVIKRPDAIPDWATLIKLYNRFWRLMFISPLLIPNNAKTMIIQSNEEFFVVVNRNPTPTMPTAAPTSNGTRYPTLSAHLVTIGVVIIAHTDSANIIKPVYSEPKPITSCK